MAKNVESSRKTLLELLWQQLMGLNVAIVGREREILELYLGRDDSPNIIEILIARRREIFGLLKQLTELIEQICEVVGNDDETQDAVLGLGERLGAMWRWEPKNDQEIRDAILDPGPFDRRFIEAAEDAQNAVLRVQLRLFPSDKPGGVDDSDEALTRHLEPRSPTVSDKVINVLATLTGTDLPALLGIIHNENLSGEEKMKALGRADKRLVLALDSPQWGSLIGVTPNAVRGYETWGIFQAVKNRPE